MVNKDSIVLGDWEITKNDGTLLFITREERLDFVANQLINEHGFKDTKENFIAMRKLANELEIADDWDMWADLIREYYD